MDIRLRAVDAGNWRQVITLEVNEDQQGFVASNLYSLAEAAYEPNLFPLAIYDETRLVGFAMIGFSVQGDYKLWYIMRFMIDRFMQRKGYGRAGMQAVLRRLRNRHSADGVLISYVPENTAAAALYASLGFVEEGLTWDDETLAVLRFAGHPPQ